MVGEAAMTRRDPATGDLFASIPRPAQAVAGGLDFGARVAQLTSDMLVNARARDSGQDRYGIAACASRLAGREISKATLDGYSSESRDAYNLPLWKVPALEVACGSTALTQWLCEVRGGRLVLGGDALDIEIGRLEREREVAADRLRELREFRRRARP
jgi:hypothetical protein